MKWKNKLKAGLTETIKTEKAEIHLEKALTKADKTNTDAVSSVFVSDELAYFPKNFERIESVPECSICSLKLEIWKNELFCAMGCEMPTDHN